MAVVAPNSFALLLEKSDLLTTDELQQARTIIETAKGDSVAAARVMIKQNLLTRWQAEQLLRGRGQLLLGKYELLDRLGEGGMGHVFLAEHRQMKRRVALKTLNRELAKDPIAMKRLVAEARAIASLDHPNIIRAYDLETEGDLYYIVMEYVEGRDLERIITADKKLPVRTAAEYIRQAAAGLAHAHEKGMVHRDIKPANLLVDKQGVVKILDLGLAQLTDHGDQSGQPVEGTVDYLSPEQATGSKDFDHRADIYSLGCTMYYSLTGHAPFPDGSIAQKLTKHQMQEPKAIDQERPETPGMLVDICRRMMAKNPKERFQSAGDIVAALTKWLSQAAATPATATPAKGARQSLRMRAAAPLPRRSARNSGEIAVDQSGGHDLSGAAKAAGKSGSSGSVNIGDPLDFISGLADSNPGKSDTKKLAAAASGDTVSSGNKTGGMKTVGAANKKPGSKHPGAKAAAKTKTAAKDKGDQPKKPRMLLWAGLAVAGISITAAGIVAAIMFSGNGKDDAAKKKAEAAAIAKKEEEPKPVEKKAFAADEDLPEVAKKKAEAKAAKELADAKLAEAKAAEAKLAETQKKDAKAVDPKAAPNTTPGDPAAPAGPTQVASVDSKLPAGPPKTGNPIIDAMPDDKPADAPKTEPAKPAVKPAANVTPPAKPPAVKPTVPAKPPEPAVPVNPLDKLVKAVDLPALPKAGENPDETAPIGQIDAALLANLECNFVPPVGANGKPLPQFGIVRKDAEPGVPGWQITAKSNTAGAVDSTLASVAATKDGNLNIGWKADAAKGGSDQIRNAVLQFKSGSNEHVTYLRAPNVIEPLALDLEGKLPKDADKFNVQKQLDLAALPLDTITLEIQKFDVQTPTFKIDLPAKPQSPLPTSPKDKDAFVITVGEKAGVRNTTLKLNFQKRGAHPVLEVYPQYVLPALGPSFGPPQPLHMAATTLESQLLKKQIADIVGAIKNAKDKKNTELATNLETKQKALAAADKEMDGINTVYGGLNKTAKLYFRVFAKVENYEIDLLNTGPLPVTVPVPAKK